MPPRPTLTVAKSGPIDHIAAYRDHARQAKEHALAAEAELVAGIIHNANEALEFSRLELVKPGVAEECRQLAEYMQAAAQRIVAIGSKGNG